MVDDEIFNMEPEEFEAHIQASQEAEVRQIEGKWKRTIEEDSLDLLNTLSEDIDMSSEHVALFLALTGDIPNAEDKAELESRFSAHVLELFERGVATLKEAVAPLMQLQISMSENYYATLRLLYQYDRESRENLRKLKEQMQRNIENLRDEEG